MEKVDDADSLYEIAHIFIDSEMFRDMEEANKFLLDSAEKGNCTAKIELVLEFMFEDKQIISEDIALVFLNDASSTNFAPALFVLGYAYEFGILVKKNINEAFKNYYKSAQIGYEPAKMRLSSRKTIDNFADIQQYFTANIDTESNWAKYCMACAMFYHYQLNWKDYLNDRIEGNRQVALNFFQELYESGYSEAAYDLAYAYHYGVGVEKDKKKALKFYEEVIKDDDCACVAYINLLINI